ncbi:pentatricopeptide repeat-containing protein At5g39350-like [Lotus japonicus]|uniref:pentatricopeptide repeat-containing protein At5g39350-like n=1 Tax=Lotus japonicus TaxID=34305 RepID=UPI002587FC13|nr:pentatricopeptide repeat-containing protein At5g39350-like [Lotus japonicus]XP_057428001.1 pentatricopeptide repeat-containing protein At5g39350-like [Lotus japonicus]XP_057428002.1 pentatricopeptide repeat-containing protein At5g39350-like [Lotus japonicus]
MNGPMKRIVTTATQCESLLRKFSASNSLSETKKLHAFILTSGLLSSSTNLSSKLATTYAHCHHASYASHLFDTLPQRSLFSWNTMMRMYVQMGRPHDALNLFVEMIHSGLTLPDNFTYPIIIKACSDLSFLDMGVGVHGMTFKAGFDLDTFVQNSLLAMYMNAGEKEQAQLVFDLMKEQTVVSWNTMINGYFRNNRAEEALRVYNRMMDAGVEPDCATVVSVLPACGLLKNVELGREVHALVKEKGFWGNMVVRNAMLDMYVKCGQMKEAWWLANEMDETDVVTWTTLINGYILNGDARSALMLCRVMLLEGVKPNLVSVASLLSACGSFGSLNYGKCLHAWAIRQKLESEVIVETALIDMYAKCNCGNLSYKVFMKTSKKRTAPWNALLSGFIHNSLVREAIQLFKQMLVKDVQPDNATFNSLLPAYAVLADLKQAMNIHCYLIRSGFLYRLEVASILVDIYSKCGSLGYAHHIFNIIPLKDKDIIIWSSIIAAYGKHGHGEMAVSLFNQMVQSGVQPNQITFTSVLHACSHAGLVDEGLSLFKFMLKQHQIIPLVDHYTCIIDLLGRAGQLNDAYNLIRTMPIKPNHAVWGALLGACVSHENVELGEVAARWTFELEPENTGNYVLLANLYAAVGRWRDAENVRDMVNVVGLRKLPAQSLVEVRSE